MQYILLTYTYVIIVFYWENIYIVTNKTSRDDSGNLVAFTVPGIDTSFYWLIGNFLTYLLLALYLDKVLDSPNGEPVKWYSIFTPSYWGRRESRDNSIDGEEEKAQLLPPTETDTSPLVQLQGLGKRFESGSVCKKKKFTAVKDVWLDAEENEILALLGHNGAGKTTTIKMLTGLLRPTQGQALLASLSISTQMSQIRQLIGVCPQHDILWQELTPRQHFELFGMLKGLGRQERRAECEALLSDVKLDKNIDQPVQTFSGGMKRRLSVALAFIGQPRIVFLDEPSTGMDPCVRRELWNLILRMRENRLIIMTTHVSITTFTMHDILTL